MRHQMWALAIATLPIALWSAPPTDGELLAHTPAPEDIAASQTPRQLYRAAQALEYNDQLTQAQALYAQVASAVGPEHPLADDVVIALLIIDEKLSSSVVAAH